MTALCLGVALFAAACGAKPSDAAKTAPAKVDNPEKETDLATITLTAEAEKRLGIEYAATAFTNVARSLTISGEIVPTADAIAQVSSPMAGTLVAGDSGTAIGTPVRKGQAVFRLQPYLAPERGLVTQLERDVESAETRIAAAKVRLARAEQLVRDKAGPQKAVDQAREELALAETDARAAREKLTKIKAAPAAADVILPIAAPRDGVLVAVHVAAGQTVANSAVLFEVSDLSTVWVRVPVYVGDIDGVDRSSSARIGELGDSPGSPTRSARPVSAPPTANASASTADLYYALSNGDGRLRPGERVAVILALKSSEESLVVPWSAVLHDINGGTWVYENTAPQVFVRRPVEVRDVVDRVAVLARGPAPGTRIVTTGAAELFSTEFGAGK
ncbi:MAG: efflux RND transporter periplasmic adaptor subunit [Acidobacteria bacterium]|nr:efflux RND transporter periplasmic adaptor subunit [Acidobacteriota bacterium]